MNVLKFLYRTKSYARTVPSSDAVKRTCPCFANSTVETEDVWSEKVTKQKPDVTFQIFTFPSSPPVATFCPSEENDSVFIS